MILRVSMSSSIDSRFTCVGTRSRQTSIHDPSPQPVSQERGAGEPVGLHHGPSLRRRRGGGEKKNKNPAMELSPPPLGISEAAAAPPAVRSLQLQFPARMLRLPPLPPVPRCAVPRGAGPARRPGGAQKRGWGDAQQVPLVGSRSEMQKKKIPPPPGRAGSRDKMVPFWTRAAVARWQGQDSSWPGQGEGAGPTGGRLPLAGARTPAGSWAGRCGRRQRTHPHTHTRALAAAAAAAAAAGGWRRLVH